MRDDTAGARMTIEVETPGARIHVETVGSGHDVVLLPAFGRDTSDFAGLARELARAGYRAVMPDPRGVRRSVAKARASDLHDLASDVARVIEACCTPPVTVLGYSFGNRVARTLASDRPDLVDGVILIGCGGNRPLDADVASALMASFRPELPRDERLRHVARAFFADERNAAAWADGWHPSAAAEQWVASSATPVKEWWVAGDRPVLILQPAYDAISTIENASALAAALGSRAQYVEIPASGHAALSENPPAVATAIRRFLQRRPRAAAGRPPERRPRAAT